MKRWGNKGHTSGPIPAHNVNRKFLLLCWQELSCLIGAIQRKWERDREQLTRTPRGKNTLLSSWSGMLTQAVPAASPHSVWTAGRGSSAAGTWTRLGVQICTVCMHSDADANSMGCVLLSSLSRSILEVTLFPCTPRNLRDMRILLPCSPGGPQSQDGLHHIYAPGIGGDWKWCSNNCFLMLTGTPKLQLHSNMRLLSTTR